MYLLLLKFASLQVLFLQHFYRYALTTIGIAIAARMFITLGGYVRTLRVLMVAALLALAIWYFGLSSVILLSILIGASCCIGVRLFKGKELVLGAAVSFFFMIQIFMLIGMVFFPSVAFRFLVTVSLMILAYALSKQNNIKKLFFRITEEIHKGLSSLVLVEIFLVIMALIYGSLPQSAMNWDSVYANLYNARWYVELDSFRPIVESISSIFPQQAIVYYAFFFTIGGLRSLQIAYILPLLLLFFVIKKLSQKFSFSPWYQHAVRLLLFVPIVLAQSASGYYDLFIASMIMLSIYSFVYSDISSRGLRSISSALFLGIAVASKFFAAIFAPFLVVGIGIEAYRTTKKQNLLVPIFFLVTAVLLTLGPLSIWMYRSYSHTGSPIFPFFQGIFRTKELWSSVNSVEQNPMTQSTMSGASWLKGGFLMYPILSYFRTENFVEGTRGYSGLVYIILLPIQVFFIALSLWRLLRRKFDINDVLYLCLFTSFVFVGGVVRYYRYLWPFQFAFGVMTFVQLWRYVRNVRPYAIWIFTAIIVFLYAIHAVDLMESYRFVPEQPKERLFHPEIILKNPTDPLFSTINQGPKDKPILDASQYTPSRLYFAQRTYMCNWYWVAGDKKVLDASKDIESANAFLRQFSFIITSPDPTYSGNYCVQLIKRATNLQKVANDEYHDIYIAK